MDTSTNPNNHRHSPPPPPPPPPAAKLELHHHLHHHELKSPIPLSFSNGSTLKKHTLHHQLELPTVYRECLKNHAASLGGHALDGCGEFLPSPSSNPSVPSSLTCAACGCHRNFHRRLTLASKLNYDDDLEDDEDDENDGGPDHVSSAPRMLMALSVGGSRKRFRTRFSPEQKARMHDLSERLGWRLHKRDEKLVEDSCRDIGVEKGVFKVWMHNNKHNLFSARRQTASNTPQLNAANGSSTSPSLVPLPPPPPPPPPPSQPDSDSSLLSR